MTSFLKIPPVHSGDWAIVAWLKTLKPSFLRGIVLQTFTNFRSWVNHILEKNTADGTIVLVPWFICHPSTLKILAEALKSVLGNKYNIIFAKPKTKYLANHIDRVGDLWDTLHDDLRNIQESHETNGNMILLSHSLGWPAIVSAIAQKGKISDNTRVEMLSPPFGFVPIAGIPFARIFPALEDLRKKKMFSDGDIQRFLHEVSSVEIHQTWSDSLVPSESQDLKGLHPGVDTDKVKTYIHKSWNHLTAVNGSGVRDFARWMETRVIGHN